MEKTSLKYEEYLTVGWSAIGPIREVHFHGSFNKGQSTMCYGNYVRSILRFCPYLVK